MKPVQDNFSVQAEIYKKYRPVYPIELYEEILKHVQTRQTAWDCGTGNGQVAYELAPHFTQVYATDISVNQLKNAPSKENIRYEVCRAEQTPFTNNQFDLITVAQAIHWFDFDLFYEEVRRTGKSGGILAVWSYGLLKIDGKTDPLIDTFYTDIIGPYWDKERKYIDQAYQTIPFDFAEIPVNKSFRMEYNWNLEEFVGYLNTWSSVQQYIKQLNDNPVNLITRELAACWNKQEWKKITFPLFLRLGIIR